MTIPIRPPGASGFSIDFPQGSMSVEKPDGSFGDLFTRALGDATELEGNAKDLITRFLRGEPVELHQIMAASEEASISLELLVEIRNKLTEAYRSVMNVQ